MPRTGFLDAIAPASCWALAGIMAMEGTGPIGIVTVALLGVICLVNK